MRLAKLRSKRAISPIIATVLLIAITIAAGLAIYGWVSGLMSAGTSSKLTGTTSLTLSVQQVYDNTSATGAASGAYISVYNGGSYDVNLVANPVTPSKSNLVVVASDGSIYTSEGFYFKGTWTTSTSSITINVPAGATVTFAIGIAPGTYTLKIVNAQDVQGNTVVSNSVSFTVP